jgi:hypothetical protein
MAEANREFDLLRRARSLATAARVLHVYAAGSIALLAFGGRLLPLWQGLAGAATALTAIALSRIAKGAGRDLPIVEHRADATMTLERTAYAISVYAVVVAVIGVASILSAWS